MKTYEVGTPYMDQAPALPAHLRAVALKGAEVVADHIAVEGNPSFPEAVRGSVKMDGGTFVSFESIRPDHAVLHMHSFDGSTSVRPKKVAESGEGFYYALPADMTATEARRLALGMSRQETSF